MSVSVIIPVLALASLSAAFAPNCEDMLKPYIPQDPKEVRPAFANRGRLKQPLPLFFFFFLRKGFWKMGVCDGSRGPSSIPQSAGVDQELLGGADPYV